MENGISNLTDDCLLNIFKHCDIQSLGRLARTCKRYNNIVKNEDSVWIPNSRKVIGSNMNSPYMAERSLPALTPIQRCKVSRNWTLGNHKRTTLLRYATCLPWMYLEKDYLYVSKGRKLVKFFRNENGDILGIRIHSGVVHEDDISKFCISGETIYSVGWDGKVCLYKKYTLDCTAIHEIHQREILAVDSNNDVVVTGSKDGTIKILNFGSTEETGIIPASSIDTNIRVLSLSLLPSTKFLIAGLPGTKGIHPLPIFDLENEKILTHLGEDFLYGGGIIDIYPESENLVLTCGYDTTLKLWDIRTPKKCVSQWVEPYDNILYTVKSDHSVTLVAGANRSGFFHVWDKRSSAVIRTHHNAEFNSPVYCLTFDASHVYCALNKAAVQDSFKSNI